MITNVLYLRKGVLYHVPTSQIEFCDFYVDSDDSQDPISPSIGRELKNDSIEFHLPQPLYPRGGHMYYFERAVARTWGKMSSLETAEKGGNESLGQGWETRYIKRLNYAERKSKSLGPPSTR